MANIAFHGSHNSAIAVEENGKIVCVIEIERFISKKNSGYSQYSPVNVVLRKNLLKEILKYIENEYGITNYETCLFSNTDCIEDDLYEEISKNGRNHFHVWIPAKKYISCLHHESHASCAFYQTDYEEALIISFDGGGSDGFFNIYHAKNRNTINLLEKIDLDLGFPYMSLGDYLGDIKKEPALNIGNLVYSGKIMGLCSYGNLNESWLKHFENYYKSKPNGLNYLKLLDELGNKVNLKFDVNKRFSGQMAWDIAKTSQTAFENVFMEIISPFLVKYPKIPLIITGGCALNIILNTKLKEETGRDVFVPPNPNDCGLALGMLLNLLKPNQSIDATYTGISILDKHTLMSYVEEELGKPLEIKKLVDDLREGKIVGVVRGNSEHGPRALGNRSIFCNPSVPNMKDKLNQKVKNREWYRPFAPVCRLEDANKYFVMDYESRWMSFCPKVRDEWKEKLVSITHVDGTARVQTVTKEQNPWLYELLTEFEKKCGFGVLLNTSFNINGKPLISKYSEAFTVYKKTELDCLLLEEFYFTK